MIIGTLQKFQKGKIKSQYFNRISWVIRGLSATNQHQAKQLIQDLITELLNGEEYCIYYSHQGFNASFQTLLMSLQGFFLIKTAIMTCYP